MTASTNPGLEEGFLRRVGTASLLFSVLGGLFGAYHLGWRWGVGFAAAGVWSALNLKALEHLIRLSLRPSGRQSGAIAGAILVKLPLLYGIGGWIVVKGGLPIGSILIGLSVPTAVMVLKAGGQILASRLALHSADEKSVPEENEKGRSDGRNGTQ